jgi:RNA polymerase sigma-70 factor (ECF subfamily)
VAGVGDTLGTGDAIAPGAGIVVRATRLRSDHDAAASVRGLGGPVVASALVMSDPSADQGAADSTDDVEAASDELLLLGIRMRDETALMALYDRYSRLVFTLALRMLQDRELAEEVMQDVFVRCWQGLEQFDRTRGTLPGWLLGIGRNRAITIMRTGQHQVRERAPLPATGQNEPSTPDRGEEVVMRATVVQALAELSLPQREAIELAYYGGLTQSEVAVQLAQPLDTVKTRIRDGLRRLRRVLAPTIDGRVAEMGGAS